MGVDPFGPEWQLRALIARHRYGNGVVRDLAKLLRTVYQDLAQEIADSPARSFRRQQAEALLQVLQERLREVSTTAAAQVRTASQAMATAESEAIVANANVLRVGLGLPPRTLLVQAARLPDIVANVAIGGYDFDGWWAQQAVTALARTRVAVQSGIVQGLNPLEIARRIYSREVTAKTVARQHLAFWNTAVRTTVTAAQTQSTLLELKDMPDLVESAEFQAVLDVRTSDICKGLDGGVYKITDPKLPTPPLHPNCRSALVPITKGVPRLARGQTYDQWLRGAGSDVQDTALGAGRAALYRDGKLTLSELVSRDGTSYTLTQLRERLMPDAAQMTAVARATTGAP